MVRIENVVAVVVAGAAQANCNGSKIYKPCVSNERCRYLRGFIFLMDSYKCNLHS
jgi:hypothetical protein